MLVFIDESGDAGFKVAKGSTPVFVAAMVIFADQDEASRVQALIRSMLGSVHRRREFKFNQSSYGVRDTFFEAVQRQTFIVRAVVVQKKLIWSERLRSDDESFYKFFIKSMVKFDNQSLRDALVVIDGSGERVFRRQLSTYLRSKAARGAISKVKFRDSVAEPLLQLADMCAGAIARSYREDRDDPSRCEP